MRAQLNAGRLLAISIVLYVFWLWITGRVVSESVPPPLKLDSLDPIQTVGALAILCITLVAIIKLLVRRDS